MFTKVNANCICKQELNIFDRMTAAFSLYCFCSLSLFTSIFREILHTATLMLDLSICLHLQDETKTTVSKEEARKDTYFQKL